MNLNDTKNRLDELERHCVRDTIPVEAFRELGTIARQLHKELEAKPSEAECELDCGSGKPPVICLDCFQTTLQQDAESCDALEQALAKTKQLEEGIDKLATALEQEDGVSSFKVLASGLRALSTNE